MNLRYVRARFALALVFALYPNRQPPIANGWLKNVRPKVVLFAVDYALIDLFLGPFDGVV
jgi:hypothetical protein